MWPLINIQKRILLSAFVLDVKSVGLVIKSVHCRFKSHCKIHIYRSIITGDFWTVLTAGRAPWTKRVWDERVQTGLMEVNESPSSEKGGFAACWSHHHSCEAVWLFNCPLKIERKA